MEINFEGNWPVVAGNQGMTIELLPLLFSSASEANENDEAAKNMILDDLRPASQSFVHNIEILTTDCVEPAASVSWCLSTGKSSNIDVDRVDLNQWRIDTRLTLR